MSSHLKPSFFSFSTAFSIWRLPLIFLPIESRFSRLVACNILRLFVFGSKKFSGISIFELNNVKSKDFHFIGFQLLMAGLVKPVPITKSAYLFTTYKFRIFEASSQCEKNPQLPHIFPFSNKENCNFVNSSRQPAGI